MRGGEGHFVANNCRQPGSPRTREAGKQPFLRLSSLRCGFIFSTSPRASVPSLPVGSLSLARWYGCPKWWLPLEATGPPRSTALGLGVPEKPIGLAWVTVSALSTQPGEAGPVASRMGWGAVLGTDATVSAVWFMMHGLLWGRMGKWGLTLLESSWYDGGGRPTADLPKMPQDTKCGSPPLGTRIPWEKLEFADLWGGQDGCTSCVSRALAWS